MSFKTRILGKRDLMFSSGGQRYLVRVRPVEFKPRNIKVAGLESITDERRFEIPKNMQILVVDPQGDNAASSMWNLLSVLSLKEHNNKITLAHLVSNSKIREKETAQFARSLDIQNVLLRMKFEIGKQEKDPEKEGKPIDETEGLSSKDAEKVAEQVVSLKPDIIFMPHYLEGVDRHGMHRKSSCLYLYAIARMIAANIEEACEERPESAFSDEGRSLLAAKLLVYFYENLGDFHGAGTLPNLYNLFPQAKNLRLKYGESFMSTEGKQKLLLRVMEKNVKNEINPLFLAVKKEFPFEFFIERFIAAEVEVLAIKVEGQDLEGQDVIEMLSPENYAAKLIGYRKEGD